MTTPGAGPRAAATSDTGGATSHLPPAGPAPESDRIAQIRGRLAAATPGPWAAECVTDADYDVMRQGDRRCLLTTTDNGGTGQEQADAEFIAAAPDDIAYLLAEIDRLTVHAQTVRGEAYARVGELAAQRAAVLKLCDNSASVFRDFCDFAGNPFPAVIAAADIRRALGAES